MKRLTGLLCLLILVSSVTAQKRNVNRALNYKESGELGKALEYIQAAINPKNEKSKKSINWPRTWEVRGEIYQAMYHSDDKKFKEPTKDPLTEALNSYKKAIKLDVDNKYSKSIKIMLMLLINDLQAQAVRAFNDTAYHESLNSFEQILEINKLTIINEGNEEVVDTAIIYNCGLAALNSKDFDKAIRYFKESAFYNYNDVKPYIWVARAYKQKKDSLNALKSLKKGYKKFPEDIELINEMIETFINLELNNEAIELLDTSIKMNPDDINYYVAKGNVYDKINDEKSAIESYEKAISIDSESFEALFNLGVIYYNKGINQVEKAKKIPVSDNSSYQKELNKSEIWWEKALPFMEKCYEIDAENKSVLESLKTLYYRLKMMDKYNLILDKI